MKSPDSSSAQWDNSDWNYQNIFILRNVKTYLFLILALFTQTRRLIHISYYCLSPLTWQCPDVIERNREVVFNFCKLTSTTTSSRHSHEKSKNSNCSHFLTKKCRFNNFGKNLIKLKRRPGQTPPRRYHTTPLLEFIFEQFSRLEFAAFIKENKLNCDLKTES